jgi:LCP family protein required for cell wall assembly
MEIQKKTKIALLLMVISAVALVVVILLFVVKPSRGKEPHNDPNESVPVVTVTPTPRITSPVDSENNENNDPVEIEEPEGLTNRQKYYKPLVEEGSKNILLVGKDAVYGAYDTVMVLSIDEKTKTMKLINFPRDIYIDYNDKILEQFKEAEPVHAADNSIQKLNAAHTIGSSLKYKYDAGGKFGKVTYMNFWADLLEEIFDIKIDDYVIIQTDGFREIVDLFGGVYIYVPIYMHYEDPFQNLYIHLEPGPQLLNGEQAEGFVRFRQGYTPEGEFKTYSVYFRQQNQNKFLKAFFEQHVNLSNLSRAGELADVIAKNVKTSVNEWSKILEYINLGRRVLSEDYETSSIIVECTENRNIRGIIYEILKTE